MKHFILTIVLAALLLPQALEAASVTIDGQTAGPTPFISQLQLTASPPTSVKSIKFQISPKPGSVTRPLSATYSIQYLQKRGYFNAQTGAISLPVFGLYADFSNTVTLTYVFTDDSSQQASVMVSTPTFSDPCGYGNPTIIQARTNSTTLSYDYILLKGSCSEFSPTIIDTDGRIRWVGTGATGLASFWSGLFQNGIYTTQGAILLRMELDGTSTVVGDYSSAGVAQFHHNIDPGKRGIILDVDTPSLVESVNMEVDALGNILKTWNLADIITAAMTAGGDDPTQFVKPAPTDWFHNNAVTYKSSDDSLLVSSRENFVICLDYETSAIKWILGDTTKKWFQFMSLKQYALTLDTNTLPPIGQHALSVTQDDNLLLFDNGRASLNNTPAGADRTYSAPRKYSINTQTKIAKELWNYPNNQALYSPYCSSIYEDSPLNYLIDYAYITSLAPSAQFTEVLGLDALGDKVFDYLYSTFGCGTAWNAIPVHLEGTLFATIIPLGAVSRKTHGAAGTSDVTLPLSGTPGVECRSGGPSGNHQVVVTFKTPVIITTATVTPGSGGTASVVGSPGVTGNQVTVNLTNVSNAQTITVNLIGVNDGSTTENISLPMGVLLGDTTGNGAVNASDLGQTKGRSGQTTGSSNFRSDVTVNGNINASDVGLVKSKSGTTLPASASLPPKSGPQARR